LKENDSTPADGGSNNKKDSEESFSVHGSESSESTSSSASAVNEDIQKLQSSFEFMKEKKWSLLHDRNQIKLKEMKLQKIVKLVDILSVPALQEPAERKKITPSSTESPREEQSSSSSSSVLSHTQVYREKLFKWIEELENFEV
jgi:hypothetical protein